MTNQNQLPSYTDDVTQYTKRDAVHALLFAVYVSLLTLGFSVSVTVFARSGIEGQFGVVLMLPALLPLLFIVKKKGQSLHSLGLRFLNWKKAVGVGLFFVAILMMLFGGLLPGLLAGWQFQSGWVIAWLVVYTLAMAFWEDVIFIGYIQTRIYGLIKKDKIAVLAVGLIFAVIHYPLVIVVNILMGGGFGFAFWINLMVQQTFFWLLMHILLNAVFRCFRSIIPVTMLHFAVNFSNGRLWVNGGGDGFNTLFSLGVVVFSVVLVTETLSGFQKQKILQNEQIKYPLL